MAQTTTAINACNVNIWLERSSDGAMIDISGSANQVSLSMSITTGRYPRTAEGTVGVNDYPRRRALMKDARFGLTVLYTTTASEGFDLLRDWYFADLGTSGSPQGSRIMYIDVPGGSGSDRYDAVVYLTQLDIPLDAGAGGPVMVSAALELAGSFELDSVL